MSEYTTVHIKSAGGTEFYRHVAVFAYAGYVAEGYGVVLLRQNQFLVQGDSVEATVVYVPYGDEDVSLPPEAEAQVEKYDPVTQCVLCMADAQGKGSVLTLSGEQLGTTPEELYRKAMTKGTGVPFIPGALLRMKERIGEQEPGYVVYLKTDKAMMLLGRARSEEDGDIVPTGERFEVHVDFVEWFEDTGITIN